MMRRDTAKSERGMTMIEVMLAVVVFVVGGSGLVSGLTTAKSVQFEVSDRQIAMEMVLAVADELRATPIDTVVGVWGPGGTRGPTFVAEGLPQGTGPIGTITIVTDETLTDDQLGMPLLMPRDLDGDGLVQSTDVSTTAVALPVIIEANWGPPARRERFRIPVILIR